MRVLALLPALFGVPSFATLINTQFPHLLLPLRSAMPNMAFPTQDDATVSYNATTKAQVWTAVNFDVPNNAAATCRLNFHINQDEFKKAPFRWSGTNPRAISVSRTEPRLSNGRTTWNNKPDTTRHVATFMWSQQNGLLSVVNEWFECPKGKTAQFVIHPASEADMELYWFELDYPAAEGGAHGITLEMHT